MAEFGNVIRVFRIHLIGGFDCGVNATRGGSDRDLQGVETTLVVLELCASNVL